MLKERLKAYNLCDKITAILSCCICIIATVDIIRYACLGELTAFFSILAVNLCFMFLATAAVVGRCYLLYLPVAVGAFILAINTNYFETTLFNVTLFIQAGISLGGGVFGVVFAAMKRVRPNKLLVVFLAPVLLFVSIFSVVWGASIAVEQGAVKATRSIWAVPEKFDGTDCPEAGKLESVTYQTKAYATDEREVTKRANVYLPFGYDESKEYNILYLLHGTGENEDYWLKTFQYNKTMLDNMIYHKVIEPLIVVTPTFYVENDCMNDLDVLTYSFKEELRNDLMPAIESTYSTYAEDCTEEGFTESRLHRAFAGLSRGAVTTLHSVFNGCFDYFSSFGTFSASRTDAEYFKQHIQIGDMATLPIDYWYVASGAFDFGLVSQIQDYNAVLEIEPRLQPGINTTFDVFPMQIHSMDNWHLALYNFLQKIF